MLKPKPCGHAGARTEKAPTASREEMPDPTRADVESVTGCTQEKTKGRAGSRTPASRHGDNGGEAVRFARRGPSRDSGSATNPPKLPSQKSAGHRQSIRGRKQLRMASTDAENFRLAVLNPAGRDPSNILLKTERDG